MYQDIIYNRHMFYRDKKYDYRRFCERIVTSKSRCHPPPPIEYPFLKSRQKKHQMMKEKQEEIDYNKILLLKKYKSMYKKHNKYHPSNMHFLFLPPSLKFSSFTQNYYEFVKQNNYLGNKIKEIQKSPGNYNKQRNMEEYKKAKLIGDKLVESSKYKNMLLNLISPFTYEKRLNKLIESNKNKKMNKISKPQFYHTEKGFFPKKKFDTINSNNYYYSNNMTENSDIKKKIIIERENMAASTKEDTI